jgi:hypothetical protein
VSDRDKPYVRMDRRLFLKGLGGALLAIPFLPSILEKAASAQQIPIPKCFLHYRTPHGAIATANMWPGDNALTEQMTYLHDIRRGALHAPVSGGNAVISPVLTASASVLTPSLLAKMNILRGLDIPCDIGHNFGGALGYYDKGKVAPIDPRATIDQVMAYSPAFYPSTTSVRRRSVQISAANSGSYGYQTPGVRSSGVSTDDVGASQSSQDLFDVLLGGVTSTTSSGPPPKPPGVDAILASYKQLRNGNKRLSQDDKLRLDQHINAVAELQRRLNVPLAAGCTMPARPTVDNMSLQPMDGVPTKNVQFFTLLNEVLAVAMNCGSTRIASLTVDENNQNCTFTTRPAQGEDWHDNVAHNADDDATAQDWIRQFNQTFFSGVFMDMVSRLDSFPDGAGGTLLDHCLVAWGQECGNLTHLPWTMPIITAGSAGGAIKTGSYCDYRNRPRELVNDPTTGNQTLCPGLLYNQWLTTALLAMGVPQSEWAETDHPGYGAKGGFPTYYYFNDDEYPDAMWQKCGEILPYLV